jgi:hypothetical protein
MSNTEMSYLLLLIAILIYSYIASLFIRACRPPPGLQLDGEGTDFSRNMPPEIFGSEGEFV